jgi:hypothetical protein
VALGLHLLAAVIETHPQAFRWQAYRTAANPGGASHLARLLGRLDVADALAAPARLTAADVRRFTHPAGWVERLRAADALLHA